MERDYEIQVVAKAIRAIETLAEADTELGVTEVATALGISRNASFRLLYTLEKAGFVDKNLEAKKYRLGVRLFELGNLVMQTSDLRHLVTPLLKPLHEEFHETVSLAILHDGQVLYVERLESPRSLRTSFTVGSRAHAHSTSVGKAMLAFLPRKEVDGIIAKHGLPQMTSHTITDAEQLRQALERVCQLGYSTDCGENVEGVCCFGAPILDRWNRPIAGISISGPEHRLSDQERRKRIGQMIVRVSHELSRIHGWTEVPR